MIRLASFAIGISGLLIASSNVRAEQYMIFAIDGKGHFGHGVGSSTEAAVDFALSNCGQPDCKVIPPGEKSGCIALSQSFERGYTVDIGAAPTRQKAQEFALVFCAKTRPATSCKVYYSYCLPPG